MRTWPPIAVHFSEIPLLSPSGPLSSPQYSNTLQQQPAATASCCRISRSLSQILCTLCCDISCSRRGSAAYLYVLGLNSRWQPAFFLYSDFVSPFSVFSVLTHIELSVSARHHTIRILLHSRWLLRVPVAAVCGVNSYLDWFWRS